MPQICSVTNFQWQFETPKWWTLRFLMTEWNPLPCSSWNSWNSMRAQVRLKCRFFLHIGKRWCCSSWPFLFLLKLRLRRFHIFIFFFSLGIFCSISQSLKKFSWIKNYQNLANSNFSHDFWHLARNIWNKFSFSSIPSPSATPDDTTTMSFISKAKVLAQTLSEDSTLDSCGLLSPSFRPLT